MSFQASRKRWRIENHCSSLRFWLSERFIEVIDILLAHVVWSNGRLVDQRVENVRRVLRVDVRFEVNIDRRWCNARARERILENDLLRLLEIVSRSNLLSSSIVWIEGCILRREAKEDIGHKS
jgi:hypothetical protein